MNRMTKVVTGAVRVHIIPQKVTTSVLDTSDMDPELARYLNRNYWEQKSEEVKVSTTQPSAPVALSEPSNTTATSSAPKVQEVGKHSVTYSTHYVHDVTQNLRIILLVTALFICNKIALLFKISSPHTWVDLLFRVFCNTGMLPFPNTSV